VIQSRLPCAVLPVTATCVQLFYQDHLGIGGGITWGHVVSKDLTKWARVGVGLWNDEPWDSTAIYSGSCMNDVHGRMTLIYPGVCRKGSSPACLYGTTVGLAVATDPDDPLSRNFTKKQFDNPIAQVNGSVGPGGGGPPGSGGDSSAAWQNSTTGEWRFLTRDVEFSNVWSSTDDFRTWRNIGPQPGFTQGACPSFFPLPKTSTGASSPLTTSNSGTPNHVYMYSDTTLPSPDSHRTVMVVGRYEEAGEGLLAEWSPLGGYGSFQVVDNGTY
jgi:sucrose-6-phosphate hydrolase SacC (GH32 family)